MVQALKLVRIFDRHHIFDIFDYQVCVGGFVDGASFAIGFKE